MDITPRWTITTDTTVSSLFRVERTLDWDTWTDLGDQAPSTTTYVASTLAGNTAKGATSVILASGTSFASSGYAWVDGDAIIQWTGKSTNTLTGVTWHSGYGTYATGSAVVEASEYYNDLDVTPTNNAVVYRITHIDADSNESAPSYYWYYAPPAPVSSNHCVVIVSITTDVGIAPRSAVGVKAYMSTDNQFAYGGGQHLDSEGGGNTTTTNDLGLAFFHCWRNARRSAIAGGADTAYTFSLDYETSGKAYSVTVATIPDQDWVLLRDVGA